MNKFSLLFKKTVLIALVAALSFAALPVTSAHASSLNIPTDPPTDEIQITDERIEKIWARLQKVYKRQGRRLDRADEIAGKIQGLIDRMEKNGKDIASLQAALDAFDAAIKEVHPIYESAKGIINSHQGFDADGNVTDREQAVETVKDLGAKMKEIREIAGAPWKALREAIKTYRDAHRPADTDTSDSQE